jgi:hypothetical protein
LVLLIGLRERTSKVPDISDSQIEPFRPRRWHDMGGIPCQKQPAILHRLDDEAAHGQYAFLDNRPHAQLPVVCGRQACLKLFKDHLIRPLGNVILRIALEIQALQFR